MYGFDKDGAYFTFAISKIVGVTSITKEIASFFCPLGMLLPEIIKGTLKPPSPA